MVFGPHFFSSSVQVGAQLCNAGPGVVRCASPANVRVYELGFTEP